MLKKVVGVGHEQRVERVRHAAHQKGRGQQNREDMAQRHPDDRADTAERGNDDDQAAAVHAVRDPADGVLEDHGADEEHGHEK